MKHSPRRQMIRELATLFAMPLALGSGSVALGRRDEPSGKPSSQRAQGVSASVRPRIAAPKGSVMRRG